MYYLLGWLALCVVGGVGVYVSRTWRITIERRPPEPYQNSRDTPEPPKE